MVELRVLVDGLVMESFWDGGRARTMSPASKWAERSRCHGLERPFGDIGRCEHLTRNGDTSVGNRASYRPLVRDVLVWASSGCRTIG